MTYKSGTRKRDRTDLIMGNIASTRIVVTERTTEFYFAYFAPMARGEPLTPELLAMTPDPYFVKPPRSGGMPEIFGENLGVWTVKKNVKNIIEELEPGVHTFIPINLRVRGTEKDFGQYYLLYVGQVIDAVVIDETDFRDGHGRAGFEKASILNRLVGDTVLDGELIAGRHLWRGGVGRIFPQKSDPFDKRRLKAGKVEGWRFRACKLSTTKK